MERSSSSSMGDSASFSYGPARRRRSSAARAPSLQVCHTTHCSDLWPPYTKLVKKGPALLADFLTTWVQRAVQGETLCKVDTQMIEDWIWGAIESESKRPDIIKAIFNAIPDACICQEAILEGITSVTWLFLEERAEMIFIRGAERRPSITIREGLTKWALEAFFEYEDDEMLSACQEEFGEISLSWHIIGLRFNCRLPEKELPTFFKEWMASGAEWENFHRGLPEALDELRFRKGVPPDPDILAYIQLCLTVFHPRSTQLLIEHTRTREKILASAVEVWEIINSLDKHFFSQSLSPKLGEYRMTGETNVVFARKFGHEPTTLVWLRRRQNKVVSTYTSVLQEIADIKLEGEVFGIEYLP